MANATCMHATVCTKFELSASSPLTLSTRPARTDSLAALQSSMTNPYPITPKYEQPWMPFFRCDDVALDRELVRVVELARTLAIAGREGHASLVGKT